MADIAKEAGVARSTVSKVLSNKAYSVEISQNTREKVLEACQRLNYQPNQFARSLKTGKTNMVGITSMAPVRLLYDQPYAADLYTGIGDVMSQHDYSMVFHQIREIEKPQDAMRLAQAGMVDGLLYILVADSLEYFQSDQLLLLKSLHIPFVIIHSLRLHLGCPAVGLDCETGGFRATEHLINHGYLTIGMVNRENPNALNRDLIAGYKKALSAQGLPYTRKFHYTYQNLGTRGGHELAEHLVGQKPELPRALVVTDDAIAHGLIQRFSQVGIRVPDDIALIGFGSLIDPRHITNELTTIDQPGREKGRKAAEILVDLVKHPNKMKKPRSIILEPELIIRKSCGCLGH